MEDNKIKRALETLISFNAGKKIDGRLIDGCIGLIENYKDTSKCIELNGKSYNFTEIRNIIVSAIENRNRL